MEISIKRNLVHSQLYAITWFSVTNGMPGIAISSNCVNLSRVWTEFAENKLAPAIREFHEIHESISWHKIRYGHKLNACVKLMICYCWSFPIFL